MLTRPLLLFLAASLAAISLTAAAPPRTYYVSAAGNDAASGLSPAQAWRSIDRVNRALFHAGERVLFEGGRTFSGTLRLDATNVQGTADAPVTFGSFGSGRATISSADNEALEATQVAGLRITGLRFVGTSLLNRAFNKNGLTFTNHGLRIASGVTIDHVEITGFSLCAILFDGADRTSGYDGVTIDRVLLHDDGYCGIAALALEPGAFRNLTISNSEIFAVDGYTTANGHLVDGSGSGIALTGLFGATIAGNAIHDSGRTGGSPFGISILNSLAVTVQANEVFSIHTATSDVSGGGIDFNGANESSIQYNYTHDNDGPGIRLCACGDPRATMHDLLVRYNVSENDGRNNVAPSFLFAGGQATDALTIFNNTIFRSGSGGNPGSAIAVNGNGHAFANLRFSNNLVLTDHGPSAVEVADPTDATNLRFERNAYFALDSALGFAWNACSFCVPAVAGTTYTTAQGWASATGQEQESGTLSAITVDPFITSPGLGGTLFPRRLSDLAAYRLASGSALIDRAKSAKELGADTGNRDFFGYAFDNGTATDIGANEFGGYPSPPVLAPIPDQTAILGETLLVDIDATDPDGTDGLRLALTSPPAPGATLTDLGHGRGLVNITPANTLPMHLTIRATDDTGLNNETSFRVTILGTLGRQRAAKH
ncbi:MAG TPA: right-handed parallel beta-helix repeat-containing protein [Thermoanaerobaculia bacterium]|nr:right-handed parallel beta-helix repeat-containing protein [Thermoanaerobaculia bacterium]